LAWQGSPFSVQAVQLPALLGAIQSAEPPPELEPDDEPELDPDEPELEPELEPDDEPELDPDEPELEPELEPDKPELEPDDEPELDPDDPELLPDDEPELDPDDPELGPEDDPELELDSWPAPELELEAGLTPDWPSSHPSAGPPFAHPLAAVTKTSSAADKAPRFTDSTLPSGSADAMAPV